MYRDSHWLPVATKLLKAKIHSCYAKESKSGVGNFGKAGVGNFGKVGVGATYLRLRNHAFYESTQKPQITLHCKSEQLHIHHHLR